MKSTSKTIYQDITPYSFLLLGLLGLTLFSGIILSSSLVSADNDSVVDEISITVPVSCTLSGTGMTSHTAEIANGTYTPDIGTTTLKAFCNDNEGFAIYAIGYTDNEDGKNVLTSSTLGSIYDIETGTATSGDDSQWAMKLSTIANPTPTYPIIIAGSTDDTDKEQGDPDYSTFQEVPDDYTLVAKRTAGTDIGTNAEGATLKSTHQAYISKTQPAGTYTGQVKYTLVHPHTAEKPQKPLTCNPSGTTISSIVCMQDINSANKSSILSSMTEDNQYTLTDKRDGKTYTIAKLKDGNIWMTQNLDHDIVTDGSVIYDNTTTDLGWNSSTNSYDAASWIPSTATSTTIFNESYSNPQSYDPGELYWNGVVTSGSTNQISTTGEPHYHLGNYYNWTAAVALNNNTFYPQTEATQSICPTGWTLPNNSSYQNLIRQYGWSSHQMVNPSIWNTAIKTPLSGYILYNLEWVGYEGSFWTSELTDLDFGQGDYLSIDYNDNVYVGTRSLVTAYGSSIRCLTR